MRSIKNLPIFRLPYLPLWLAPLALISPVLLTGKALFWGTPFLQFVPWRALAWDSLSKGQLPLWNPFNGMGAPLLANYQSALMYPPNWLLLLLQAVGGTPAQAWGQGLVVVSHWILAGFGMALLAKRLKVDSLGQAVSGLAFGLSAYLVTRSGFLSINAAVAWLPWVILFTCRIAAPQFDQEVVQPQRLLYRIFPLALVIGLLLLAGHAQTAWYTILLAALWVVVWGWSAGGFRQMLWAFGLFLLAGVIGAALAAVQLLPTAEYLLQSQRASAVDYQFAMNFSFWPWHLLTLLAPGLFGSPASGDYWFAGYYWEDAIYIGLLPFLLATLGSISILRQRKYQGGSGQSAQYRGLVFFLLMLLPVIFILALGGYTPVYPALYRFIPTFNMFQAPARWMIWFVFALSLLAALGIQTWRRPEKRALYWSRLATAGAIAVMIGAGLAWILMGAITPTFIRATALMGFWGACIGVLNLSKPNLNSSARLISAWPWAVVFLVAADVVVANWGMNPEIGTTFYSNPAPTQAEVQAITDSHRIYVSKSDENILKYQNFLHVKTFDPGRSWMEYKGYLLADANILEGVDSANNFDPLVPGRYAQWIERLDSAEPTLKIAMLHWMDVAAIEKPDNQAASGVRFEPVDGATSATWISCAIPASSETEAWQIFSSKAEATTDPILVVEGVPTEEQPGCNSQSVAKIDKIDENTEQSRYHILADQGGWLVQPDVWYPGWKAEIDGQTTSIRIANTLFRAIRVPPGEHVVRFFYQPVSFSIGVILSLISIIGLWVWYFLEKRQKVYVVLPDNPVISKSF